MTIYPDMLQWLYKLLSRRSAFDNPRNGVEKIFDTLRENEAPYSKHRVLGLPAVYRAVKLISGKVAGLPVKVLRDTGDGRDEERNHPAARFLQAPNPYYGLRTLLSVLISHSILHGNGYALLEGFPPTQVSILDPSVTQPILTGKTLSYKTRINEVDRVFGAESVLHIKNLSDDGFVGLSVCDLLRTSLGVAIAHDTWEEAIYLNGASPLCCIELPGSFSNDEELQRFRKGWKEKISGPANAGELAILEMGAKLNRLPLNMEDAQFLQSKEFDVRVVSNITGVPCHKLAANIGTSYSSLEMNEQAFLDDCLSDWIAAIEEELNLKLRTEKEKITDSVIIEVKREALTRADLKTENDILIQELNNGCLTINQYLAIKNRPLLSADLGDTHRIPNNITTLEALEDAAAAAEQALQQPQAAPELPQAGPQVAEQAPAPADDTQARFKALLTADVARLFKRIAKSGGDIEHRSVFLEALGPAMPHLEANIDHFFAALQADKTLLDRPEDFVRDYGT